MASRRSEDPLVRPRHQHSATVFRSPGLNDAIIQAWGRSVPVISLNSNPDDVIKKEGIGFCSGSRERLGKDVRELVENKTLRKSMGVKAREYAVMNHSMKNISKLLELVVS